MSSPGSLISDLDSREGAEKQQEVPENVVNASAGATIAPAFKETACYSCSLVGAEDREERRLERDAGLMQAGEGSQHCAEALGF